MLLGTLGDSLLGNMLAGKRIVRAGYGNKQRKGILRAGYGNKKLFFFDSIHPLTNFEIQKYYQNEPIFNGVYSRDNWPKKNRWAYVINLDEYVDIGTHLITLYAKNIETIYFDSVGVEHGPKEIDRSIGHKNIKTNKQTI